jgi:hypothetical protein
MPPDDDQQKLLSDIRDILREQLDEYRRVTSKSLEIQQRAVQFQQNYGRIYKIALAVSALLVLAAILFITIILYR